MTGPGHSHQKLILWWFMNKTFIGWIKKYFFGLLWVYALGMAQTSPSRFSLTAELTDTLLEAGLTTNVVAEIRTMGDSLTWFGTGRGLAVHDNNMVFMYRTTPDSLQNLDSTNLLPQGGIPAIAVLNDSMLVAFSGDDGSIQMGLGLALTFSAEDTNGIGWTYFKQPVDMESDSLELVGGVGYFRQLPCLLYTSPSPRDRG